MKVVITGGTGFVGRRLAKSLAERGTLAGPDGNPRPVDSIISLMRSFPTAACRRHRTPPWWRATSATLRRWPA